MGIAKKLGKEDTHTGTSIQADGLWGDETPTEKGYKYSNKSIEVKHYKDESDSEIVSVGMVKGLVFKEVVNVFFQKDGDVIRFKDEDKWLSYFDGLYDRALIPKPKPKKRNRMLEYARYNFGIE